MPANLTNYDPVLKQYYMDLMVMNMVYADNPLLAMMPKHEKFPGRNLPIPIKFGNPMGRSATFSVAQDNKGNTQFNAFLLTRVKEYSLYSVDGETMEATEDDEGAFMEALTSEADGAFDACARAIAVAMYRNGTGSIGQISAASNVATATITLSNINDISNFEVGMYLVASAADGGALRSAGAHTKIQALNRITGTITTTAATWATDIAAVQASDYLYVEGDAANGGANIKISGLEAWCPSSAPGATAFFGVDRSVDVTRLGGLRYDGSAQNPEEALIDALALLCREGGRPDYVFTHTSDFANLEKSLGSKVQYNVVQLQGGDAPIGFQGIKVNTPKGVCTVLGDVNAPSGVYWGLTLKSWKLCSIGKAPKVLKYKSTDSFLRENAADSVEGRIGMYGNVGCHAPGHNIRVVAPT